MLVDLPTGHDELDDPVRMTVLAPHLQTDTMGTYSDPVSPKTGFGR